MSITLLLALALIVAGVVALAWVTCDEEGLGLGLVDEGEGLGW